MKKLTILLLLLILGLSQMFAQRSTSKFTMAIRPINGKGFSGKLDLEYAFADCFGETHMFYTYSNVQIYSFHYAGRTFSASELGLDNFNKYLIVPDIYIAEINKPLDFFKNGQPRYGGIDGGRQSTILSSVKLDNVLDTQIGGCGGQTKKIGVSKELNINPKYIYLPNQEDLNSIYNKNYATFSWEATLNELAKCKLNPDCDLDSYHKKKKDEALINHRYEISIINENRHRDPRFTNTANEKGTLSARFEVVCENPESLIPKLKTYAYSLFLKVEKYYILRVCLNCPSGYYAENIRIESAENQEYRITKIPKNSSILPADLEHRKDYLNSNVDSNVYFDGEWAFYITNFIQDCNSTNNNKRTTSNKKSYWKN